MSAGEVLGRIVPNFRESIKVKRRIKSQHVENLEELKNGGQLATTFNAVHLLGDRAENKHIEAVSFIRNNGVMLKTGYKVKDEDISDAEDLTQDAIDAIKWDIRIARLKWFVLAPAIPVLSAIILILGNKVIPW